MGGEATSTGSATWSDAVRALNRPYRVTAPMVVFCLLIPAYLVTGLLAEGTAIVVPMFPLEDLIPIVPAWVFVYGTVYLFLIILPVLVVQHAPLIDRLVQAYLAVWIPSILVFLLFPTTVLRPEIAPGDGFAAYSLHWLYEADAPYNCFPSLHVAHSFVSALAVHRVHRALGNGALLCAVAVALSTLFTNQHALADVCGGIALALVANAVFLARVPPMAIPTSERAIAPRLVVFAAITPLAVLVLSYVIYRAA